jgi:ABC-type Fe3+-siderophore transport system permease subunit
MLWKLGGTPVSLIGLIIFVALLIGRAKRPLSGTWTIAMMIILQLAVYFGIYLLTPLELTYHLKTSLDRLYLHVFPLALLWFFVWLKSPQELP